jgi:amidase
MMRSASVLVRRVPGVTALALWSLVSVSTAGAGRPHPAPASDPATERSAAWWLAHGDVAALQELIRSGDLTAEALTRASLDRIEALDGELRAVLAVDPTALEQARALDREREESGPRGPLHGIPVLIKDNIETAAQPTTAGSLALAGNDTGRDAPLVARLRQAGAVIVGKANLSEWANIRSTRSSSGWSAVGGQTRNPHDPTRSPCGSSSGSAVGVAAGYVPLAVGTETNGSVVCPASANGVVGIKPTVGLVSRTHVVPISHTQDTAGPMGRTVADAVILLEAMVGPDEADPATRRVQKLAAGHFDRNLSAHLKPDGLRGKRIGVVRSAAGFHSEVDALFDRAVEGLRRAGATIVDDLELERPDGFSRAAYDVLLHELKHDLNGYLASLPDERLSQLDLAGLIAFNQEHADEEMPWFGQEIFVRAQETGGLGAETYREALELVRKATREDGIDRLIEEHELDALVAPAGGPAWTIDLVNGDHHLGGSSTFPAVAGYPNVTVPMGAVHGLPVGLSIFGPAFSEPTLIEIASGYEQASRRSPPGD